MTSIPSQSSEESSDRRSHHSVDTEYDAYESVDLHAVLSRLFRGLAPTLGFALLGLAIGAVVYLVASPFTSATTSMRLTFAFVGYGKGEYPDHSKFQPDDVRAPDIIAEALKREGLSDMPGFASRLRGALTIEGIIPPNITKERDRLRASGQILAPYLPDEYLVTLTLPRGSPLTSRQRELLLNEIVSAYQEKFERTYADPPVAFGSAFESLHRADFFEYELILNDEIQNIMAYLNQQLDQAKTFRSSTTNLSFSDLLSRTGLFAEIQLSETLGLIRQNGLSGNRNLAMVKMDYYLRTLEDQEQKAIQEEAVVDDLLAKTQERSQNYVLGIKSQAIQQHSEAPILDQGLVDSLLANDAYNFLVRRALDSGLAVKRIQAKKEQLLERRKDMDLYIKSNTEDRASIFAQVQKSLADLEASYNELISSIRETHSDFAKQQFADAIRISMQAANGSRYRPLSIAGAVGGFIGLVFGMGLSLMGIYVGRIKS